MLPATEQPADEDILVDTTLDTVTNVAHPHNPGSGSSSPLLLSSDEDTPMIPMSAQPLHADELPGPSHAMPPLPPQHQSKLGTKYVSTFNYFRLRITVQHPFLPIQALQQVLRDTHGGEEEGEGPGEGEGGEEGDIDQDTNGHTFNGSGEQPAAPSDCKFIYVIPIISPYMSMKKNTSLFQVIHHSQVGIADPHSVPLPPRY